MTPKWELLSPGKTFNTVFRNTVGFDHLKKRKNVATEFASFQMGYENLLPKSSG
jgi:hypothetical protein